MKDLMDLKVTKITEFTLAFLEVTNKICFISYFGLRFYDTQSLILR